MAEENRDRVHGARELWYRAAQEVISQTAGDRFEMQSPVETSSIRPLCLWSSFEVSGEIEGHLSFGIPTTSRELQTILPPAMGEAPEAEAWGLLAEQISSRWAELLLEELRIRCTVRQAQNPSVMDEPLHGIFFVLKSERISLPLYLAGTLKVRSMIDADQSGANDFWDQFKTPAGASEANPATDRPENLDLLLDLEMQASLRFGGRDMTLHEILALGPGSVVSLDRAVHAPVDLVVGDRIVARGDVVLVDGNYGLRITEVAEPQRRLETVRCLF